MSHVKKNYWICISAAVSAGALVVGNTLYKVANRNDVPMFSREAFVLGWPYWIGYVLGIVAIGGYWLFCRRGRDSDA